MSIWIEKHQGEISEDYVFAAYVGFKQLGYSICFYEDKSEIDYKRGDIVVGCLQNVRHVFCQLNVELPNFYIPEEVYEFAGREIHKSTLSEVLIRKKNKETFFTKPVNIKEFPAQIVDMFPLITYRDQELHDDMECWISDIVEFHSEHRVFIMNGEVVGIQHYLGDFRIVPDWKVIDKAVACIKSQPAGWCLDFGVDSTGRTLLIEANDGYSIGNYGLEGTVYAKLLKSRWDELVSSAST